jgi:hypothetical protein
LRKEFDFVVCGLFATFGSFGFGPGASLLLYRGVTQSTLPARRSPGSLVYQKPSRYSTSIVPYCCYRPMVVLLVSPSIHCDRHPFFRILRSLILQLVCTDLTESGKCKDTHVLPVLCAKRYLVRLFQWLLPR